MSAVERLEDRGPAKPRLPERSARPSRPRSKRLLTQSPATGRAKLRPLLALAPYVARYRGRAFLAFIALTVAALTTLIVPVAVRRMIDFGLLSRRHRHDQQLFQRDDRGGRGAGRRQRGAVLSGDDHRRAHRRRSQARRVRASDLAVAGVLRFRAQRRTDLAADRRHHPDQVRGRRLGLDRAAQSDAVHRRHRDDGDHQPAAVGLRAAGDPADRDSAGGVRALGAPAVAQRPGHAGGSDRLCLRTGRRDPHRAGLYQRAAGQCAVRRRGRAGL